MFCNKKKITFRINVSHPLKDLAKILKDFKLRNSLSTIFCFFYIITQTFGILLQKDQYEPFILFARMFIFGDFATNIFVINMFRLVPDKLDDVWVLKN